MADQPTTVENVTIGRSTWFVPSMELRWIVRVANRFGSVYHGDKWEELSSKEKVLQQRWYDSNDMRHESSEWRDVPIVDEEILVKEAK